MSKKGEQQHFVPQCYLRAFADPTYTKVPGPHVWVFEKNSKKGKAEPPKRILKEEDIYTIKVGTTKDNIVERTLSKLESKYARLFREKIAQHKPLSEEEHIYLCAFVAAMMQRTPKFKDNIERFHDNVIEHGAAMVRAHGKDPEASKELQRWKQSKENAHKQALMDMLPDFTNMLMQMKVAFLCADKSKAKFITSDAPVTMFNPDLQWQRFYGPGLGQKNVQVVLPLSPEIAVCFTWQNLRGYISLEESWVQEINRMTRGHCYKQFVAHAPRVRRRWFSKYPADPIFTAKAIAYDLKMRLLRRWREWKYRNRYGQRKTR